MSETRKLADIRRENLAAWMEKNQVNGSDLASRLGVGRAYTSLIMSPSRFFGERAARSMEEKLHMPKGALDLDSKKPLSVEAWESLSDLSPGSFASIPLISIETDPESDKLIDSDQSSPPISLRREWLIQKKVTSKRNLRVVEIQGDSMEPFLMPNDIAMIDLGQTDLQENECFAIAYGKEIRVKRISRTFNGGMKIRSNNPRYSDEDLSPADAEHIRILGRVLYRAG